jgi:hypothetical protein
MGGKAQTIFVWGCLGIQSYGKMRRILEGIRMNLREIGY